MAFLLRLHLYFTSMTTTTLTKQQEADQLNPLSQIELQAVLNTTRPLESSLLRPLHWQNLNRMAASRRFSIDADGQEAQVQGESLEQNNDAPE